MEKHSYSQASVHSSFRLTKDDLYRLKLLSAALQVSMTSLLHEGIGLAWEKHQDEVIDYGSPSTLPKVIREIIETEAEEPSRRAPSAKVRKGKSAEGSEKTLLDLTFKPGTVRRRKPGAR